MGKNAQESKYTLIIDNLSSATRSSDVRRECEEFGTCYDIEIDRRTRSAIVEFKRSSDADEAWRKLDRTYVDGRRWKVNWATYDDYKFFGWKWTEGEVTRRSPSRSQSRSRSPSPGKHKSPGTPSNRSSG